MSLSAEIKSLEASLKEVGASIDQVLRAAKVNRSTWTRWKSGVVTGARYDKMERIRSATKTAIARAKKVAEAQQAAP